MKRTVLLHVLVVMIVMAATVTFAAAIKVGELLKSPEYAELKPAARLEVLNKKIETKALTSSELTIDVMSRLFMDAIVSASDPATRLDAYAALRATSPKLPQTYELEQHLATQYLAFNPATKEGDELAKLRALLRLENEKKISWPAAAPLYTGMLSLHLTKNSAYQAMQPEEKIKYIRKITAEGVVKELTSSIFIRGVGWEMLSALPVDQQAAKVKELEPGLDFFSKSSMNKSYVD